MATLTRSNGRSAYGSAGERRQQSQRKGFKRTERASLRAARVRPGPIEALGTKPTLVFKDLDFLNFLGLRQGHEEADLEAAILGNLEVMSLELGPSFAFVKRQKSMDIDGDGFNLDLFCYDCRPHRLHRLVAIELKLGRFKPRTKVRWSCT
jgi:predicted nuclease of restriction endonuclease-like (RecB) superfamily